jgi:DNA-binding NarL/FixJ family response regulator
MRCAKTHEIPLVTLPQCAGCKPLVLELLLGVIRVAIVEDERDIREGLALLIGDTPDCQVTGVFSSMEQTLEHIGRDLPDILLADIGLPGMSGIDGIRLLKARHPTLQFLVLTSYHDDQRVFAAVCAGACGYLLKKTPSNRLLDSIRELNEGGAPMTPEIARQVVDLFRTNAPPAQSSYPLTAQEMRLLKLLVDGHSYKTAAFEMSITVHAISFHARHVYEKLQVHSKSEAVAKALRNRVV